MKNRRFPLRGSLARLAAGAACALLVFACAKQMPPPGGPEDKIPPLVSGVYPARTIVEILVFGYAIFIATSLLDTPFLYWARHIADRHPELLER